jgi:anti-sigma factor RsiW
MITHRNIRLLLYDYVAATLSPEDAARVERHLAQCPACREECDGMRRMFTILPAQGDRASTLPAAFWQELLNEVHAQLPARRKRALIPPWASEWFAFMSVPRHQLAIGSITMLVVASIVTGSWFLLRHQPMPDQVAVNTVPTKVTPPSVATKRIKQYLRRSKALLVGINNMPIAEGAPLDLSLERNTSRELLQEARYLKGQPLDGRSAALINDLERIQFALANSREREAVPELRLIRGGIREENLLFKIRIAETVMEGIDEEHAPDQK